MDGCGCVVGGEVGGGGRGGGGAERIFITTFMKYIQFSIFTGK